MDESEDNMSSDGNKMTPSCDKPKPKKRSLVERELETSLTARVTSPVTGRDCASTSRYGRARRAKTDNDFCNTETAVTMALTSPKFDRTPIKSLAAYKMHASNSPGKVESSLQSQIENIYSANISLSRFASDETSAKSPSLAAKKIPKAYVKTDLIQTKETEGSVTLIKNMFSPNKSVCKPYSHLSIVLERSSEMYGRNRNILHQNLNADKASIVKTLDFDSKQKSKSKEVSVVKTLDFDSRSKRRDKEITTVMTKSELFDLEAKCEYQVGDIAWARMGTYPFWPCIVTRDPDTNMFVRKKLFGRIERNMINVTFFGDNGRRSWIVETMLRKFQGLKEFEATRDQFKPEDKKKDPRLYAALFISDKKQALWLKSVEEAETVMKEPKRLRIDLLYDLLEKSKIKQNQKSQKKVTRADSDVSLSESLLDTLFSEDDAKSDDPDRAKKRKSLDVSEVVTACLDNMAARTGLTQIQKQSHMDRWLQKAKTKTPEKSHLEITVTVEEVDEAIDKSKVRTQSEKKISKDEDKSEKKSVPKPVHQKPYSFRKSTAESANLLPGHDEHDYSAKFNADNCYVKLENIPFNDKTVRACIPVTEGKDICNKNKEYENKQKSLASGVDDQTDSEISKKIINEEVLGPNNCITANTNKSLLEMDVDCCINDNKSTQEAVDKTCKEIEDDREENTVTNTVVNDQIKSEISNKSANKDVLETENLVASEMDVHSNFNDKNQGVFVDIFEKNHITRELATNTISNKNQKETAIVESIQENNESAKNVACHDVHDQNEEIPPISVNQTNQENVLEDLPTKNSTVKDITENKDHNEMSCVSDISEVPLICDDDSLSQISILEAEKEEEKVKSNRVQCGVYTEAIDESVQFSVTVKIEENMTEKDFVKKITKEKGLLSNEIECLAEEPNDNFKYVTEKDALSDPDFSLLSDNRIAGKYKKQTLSDADFSMFDNGVAEKHENQTNEVSFQKNMSVQTFKSLTDNNIDEETPKKKNHLEFNAKNNLESEINVSESNLKNNSESKINNDLASKINIDSVSKINNDLGSEIKNDLGFEIKNDSEFDLDSKIKNFDMGSEIKKKSLKSGIYKSNSEFNIKNNDPHFEMKKNDSESVINDDFASNIKKVFEIEKSYSSSETSNGSESILQKNDSKLQIKNNCILPEINRTDLRSETKNNISEPKKQYLKSKKEGECSVVIVPLNGPVFNGYRDKKLKDKKEVVYIDSDTAKTNSEFDNLSLIELKVHTIAKTRARQNLALNKQNNSEKSVDMKEMNSQILPPKTVNVFSEEIKINGKAGANAENDCSRVLRPRIDTPVEPTKESRLERRIKEIDHETDSITSKGGNVSAKSQCLIKDKANGEDKMKNPEFVNYLELRQDILIDEHPELSYDEIVAYLYKTWLYESDSESKIKKNYTAPEINRENLGSETKNNNSESEKRNSKSTKEGECSVVVVPLNGSILNGYHDNRLKDTNEYVYADSDTVSTNSEFDDLSLTELRKHTIAKTRARRDLALNKQNSNDNLVDMKEINSQSPLPRIVNIFSGEIKIIGKADANANNDSSVVMKRILRPRIDTPVESLNPSKESSPERRNKEEIDSETASINSEGSYISAKPRGRVKDKANEKDKTKDPEFVRYLELRQDVLIDEHPELSYDEIVAYLYKTWLYEQSCKSEFVKSHDKEQINLVKGVNPDAPQVKKMKRAKQDKNKLIDIDKVFKKELIEEFACVASKDKPKRKTSEPCYVEDFSDIEDEIKLFEISKNHKDKSKPENIQQKDVASTSETKEKTAISSDIKEQKIEELSPEEYYDEVEAYFEELSTPKPNIFKGLVREKVCEICEKTSNLVKCTGCNGMFHIECVKKETDIVDFPVSTRSRKKKKKPRGRRPKSSIDSNGLDESHSDEKPQDVTVSEENISFEEIQDESHIVVADVDNFEAQLSAKMKEMIEIEDKMDYDSYSSDDCLVWDDTIAGECEIVDVQLKPKKPKIDSSNFKCNNCQKDNVPLCFVCKSPASPKSQINHRQKCQVAHCHKFYHLECLENWPQTQFSSVNPSKNKGKVNEHSEALSCPRHVCHTCVCDDPRGCKTRFSGDKLARCVRCPATYHSFTKCLPAGTQILTASHIICPRHYEHRPGKVPCHVNTGWCFICAQGGTLICCEYCPTSFHAECLKIDPPDEGYMCEDCETGRLPLYGEMVWVKLGHYRWWPGLILHPYQISPNIMAVRHSPGEFVVRFFGQYDHYWVNRGRVFPYQEGDSGRISGQKSKIDEAFTVAMEHAQRAYEILKNLEENEEESPDIASSLLPPHYVKLKINKPYGSVIIKREVEESSLTQCDCDPNDEQPCGPMSHCLNRMLLTECGPSCRAGDRCNNRAFERREYPRLTAYRTKHRGWGLKALEDIKSGQFVIEYVGELIDEEEFRRRMRRKQEIRDENFYFLTLDKERMIDAGPKGNLARFMNHCCEPNCETQKWTVLGDIRVGLFALKDIPANSELTFNYNLECAGIDKKRCMCGTKRCSGYIGAKPKQEEKETQKKPKLPTKRPYKKRKTEEITKDKNKPKKPIGRPPKPRELTDIEKDLLIIKNATNGISSDSECSGRLSSVDADSERKDLLALKRKRVSFSSEDALDSKRLKYDEDKTSSEID